MNLPGLSPRTREQMLPTRRDRTQTSARGISRPRERTPEADFSGSYDRQLERYTIIVGSPDTVINKLRHVVETLRVGSIFLWDGDGSMSHEDSMRSLKLMGEEVLPALREMGDELDLPGPYDFDPPVGSTE